MNIEVIFFGRIRDLATRQRVVSLAEGSRLIDLIELLNKEYGEDFRSENNSIQIMINGNYHNLLTEDDIPLKGGDVVSILPILVGG